MTIPNKQYTLQLPVPNSCQKTGEWGIWKLDTEEGKILDEGHYAERNLQ